MAGRNESEFPPSGCHWCGRPREGHMQRWGSGRGFHKYEAPSKRLIQERLRERYGLRKAA